MDHLHSKCDVRHQTGTTESRPMTGSGFAEFHATMDGRSGRPTLANGVEFVWSTTNPKGLACSLW